MDSPLASEGMSIWSIRFESVFFVQNLNQGCIKSPYPFVLCL